MLMQQEDLVFFPTSTVATTRSATIVNSGTAGRNLIAVEEMVITAAQVVILSHL